jgi:phenylalanyl-tRNA synthetase alpha chain
MDELNITLNKGISELKICENLKDLDQVRVKYIGKSGVISLLMSSLKNLSGEDKKNFGLQINNIKSIFEENYLQQKELILQQELNKKLTTETIDISLEGRKNFIGTIHPINIVMNKIIDIFSQLGFDIADGPEIETEYYNFEALNIPKNHPARAMQDTFYTENNNVLRTHTSPIQIRYTHNNKPPIKVIAPGRVFRVDMDATHTPMFHQMEGLWIDKNINFKDLKTVIISFLKKFFANDNLEVKFRSSFFPFTEPSAEVDIKMENGKWLEVLGCGMVHPNVLQSMQIDPNQYSGFAFGLGIDRFTMLEYEINDLRLLFENDLDFLKQFTGLNEVAK